MNSGIYFVRKTKIYVILWAYPENTYSFQRIIQKKGKNNLNPKVIFEKVLNNNMK